MRLLLLMGILVFTALYNSQALAETEFKILTLQHRFSEDLLPALQPMVGSEGTASGIQNQLIIRASHEHMVEIERIVQVLDVPRQNLRITVSRHSHSQDTQDSTSVHGRKRLGDVEIVTSPFPSNTRDAVQIGIDNNQTNTSSNSHQSINVSDGGRAYISVEQSVPFTQEWVTLTRRYVRLQQTLEFIDVTTGFTVRPRIIGNQVELEVTPRFANLNQSGTIDFEALTTTVRVNRGEWFDLGGVMLQKDEVSRAILSQQSGNQSLNNQLSIRVD